MFPIRYHNGLTITDSGMRIWWRDDRIHRDSGPALITPDGSQFYYSHGNIHRDSGPAVIRADGVKFYYFHGTLLSIDNRERTKKE